MDGLNKAMLIGNLGDNPELRFTQGGQAVLNLRMATTESYVDGQGERKERTDWHNVVIWGKRGEGLSKCLQKGSRLYVEGRIQTSTYEGKDGEKRYRTDVNATNVVLLDGAPRGDGERRDAGNDRGGSDRGRPRDDRQQPRDDRDRRPQPAQDARRYPPRDDRQPRDSREPQRGGDFA